MDSIFVMLWLVTIVLFVVFYFKKRKARKAAGDNYVNDNNYKQISVTKRIIGIICIFSFFGFLATAPHSNNKVTNESVKQTNQTQESVQDISASKMISDNIEKAEKSIETDNEKAKNSIETESITDWKVNDGVSIELQSPWEIRTPKETDGYIDLIRVAPSEDSFSEITLSRLKEVSPFGDSDFAEVNIIKKEALKEAMSLAILYGKNSADPDSMSIDSSSVTPDGIEIDYSFRLYGIKYICISEYYMKGKYMLVLTGCGTPYQTNVIKNMMKTTKINDMTIADWISKK